MSVVHKIVESKRLQDKNSGRWLLPCTIGETYTFANSKKPILMKGACIHV
jgi:hypothetical protein